MIKKFYQFLNESGGFMDVEWGGVLSKDNVMDIKDVFTFLISDEIDMEDLSDKYWHNDDDSIHDIYPEFTGQSFFAFYEKISKSFCNYDLESDVDEIRGITILIKYGTNIYESEYDYTKSLMSKSKEEKLKKCIKEFQKRIVDMGYGCKTGKKLLDNTTEYRADTITMYIIEIGIN